MPCRLAVSGALVCALAAQTATAQTPPAAPKPGRAVQVPDTLAQRLLPCTTCHGAEGRAAGGAFVPRIAGKPAGYLYEQLRHFRDGRRHNAAMAGFLSDLPDAYLHEMAQYFSALDLPYPAPASRQVAAAALSAGQRLAQRGDAARQLPACTDCHGAGLTGALPAMPGLLGLPRDYVVAQLGAWRNGSRRATAPDCMAEVARRLAPEDIVHVADWLAAQAVPQPMRPASAPTTAAPLACGPAAQRR